MWRGLDPELLKQLASIREMVALRYQSPTKEWPLVFVEEYDALLVVREWPGGRSLPTRRPSTQTPIEKTAESVAVFRLPGRFPFVQCFVTHSIATVVASLIAAPGVVGSLAVLFPL
jgi:hypothetical protein